MKVFRLVLALVASLAAQAQAKAVFAHFMVGNADNYTQSDWETDIGLAQEAHLDAFALNIVNGMSSSTPAIQLAFYVASSRGFKLFFSFDYAGNGPWDKDEVISLCNSYCNNPAYYHSNGGPLLSTFEGPGNASDWHDIKASTGAFFIPDWSSLGAKVALEQADGVADGLFNWAAWPWGDLDMNTYTDASYWMYLGQAGGKPYMMPASPWFYTNLPGYDKNWLWRGDHIWYDRWVQIIYNQPEFVEIISWNDYGESHYIGPLYDKAMEAFEIGQGPFNYAENMPHDGWRAFLPYVIDLYKEGTATINREGVQGWWRRAGAAACGDGGTTGNTASQLQLEFAPASIMTDKVFFSALLGSHADVSVTVGGTALSAAWTWTPDDGVGIYHGSADFGSATGDVVITVTRGGQTVASVSPGSAGSIGTQSCVNGLQNWNAYVAVGWGDSVSATPTLTISEQKCINGTGYENFAGLCDFSCHYSYCDSSACVCKAMGSPLPTPSGVAPAGYPAAGLDASYSGVCAFDCSYGYCPPTACSYDKSPLSTPTVSDFSPPACIGGSAIAGQDSALGGLCSYACNFGFCPYLVCNCDAQGGLHETPAKIEGKSGKAADGVEDHDLCSFACERGYCPAPTCVDTSAGSDSGSSGGGGGDSGLPGTGSHLVDPGWPSFTGQYCHKTQCSKSPTWDMDTQEVASGPFPDDCPKGEYRIVVCPMGETPGECRWQGDFPFCNPTCEPGEVAVVTSQRGSNACVVGEQALCCKSLTWSNLVASCSWREGESCGVGQTSVATRRASYCRFQVQGQRGCSVYGFWNESYCCDGGFPNCVWASCDNNVCNNQQVLLTRDPYGTSGFGCNSYLGEFGYVPTWKPLSTDQENQALCCGNPEDANPFLPAPLEWLFPTLPPDTDIPVVNMTHIDSQLLDHVSVGPLEPFGMVVIDGPADLVASFSKRDGSHVEFLDCEPSKKHDMVVYTARYICTNDSEASNCDDVHLGGAEGTVVKLPEECGYATYAVVHEIKESSNQQVPHVLRKRAPRGAVVHEVSFSYDFRNVRRASDSDPVYVRIDYSSMSDWWYEVVDQAPGRKRDLAPGIRKRFWAENDEKWEAKIAQVRQSTNDAEEKLLPISVAPFSNVIYHQTSDTCAAGSSKRGLSDDGFLSVYLNGWITTDLRWGYTMVGTISPSLNLQEAHGFYDAQISSEGTLWVDGSGTLDIDGTLPLAELFGSDGVTDFGWSHPGIVSFKPTLNMGVEMTGSGILDANFTVSYLTLPGSMIQTSSPNMGDFSGSLRADTSPYSGAVTASPLSVGTVTETVLGVHIYPQSKMQFTVFDYGQDSKRDNVQRRDSALASAQFGIELSHMITLTSDGSEIFILDVYDSIQASVTSDGVSPGWADATEQLAPGVSPMVVYQGSGESPPVREPPDLSGPPALTGDYMSCGGSNSGGGGGGSGGLVCLPLSNVTNLDTGLRDDYDGENEAANADNQVSQRGARLASRSVPFWDVAERMNRRAGTTKTHELLPRVTSPGRVFALDPPPPATRFYPRSSPYITGDGGQALVAVTPNAGYFNLQNQFDCVTGAVTDNAGPSSDTAGEHVNEMNLARDGWQFLMTGLVAPSSQFTGYRSLFPGFLVPEQLMGENSVFRQAWNTWDPGAPAGTHEDPTLSPEREMWDAVGSVRHPEYMVNLQQTMNAFKSRMMRGIAAISNDFWEQQDWDDTSEEWGYTRALEALSELRLYLAVMNYLNHPRAHAAFVASLNRINDVYSQFDAAVARNNLNGGQLTYAGLLWREFVYAVIIGRTQASQFSYRELLRRMESNWNRALLSAIASGALATRLLEIQSVLDEISVLLQYDPVRSNAFVIDTSGLFADPTI